MGSGSADLLGGGEAWDDIRCVDPSGPTSQQAGGARRTGFGWVQWPLIAVVALFLACTAPLVAMGRAGFAERWDEQRYHLPVILEFAESMPRVDLVHYGVAMTPGWHLGMAVLWRVSGGVEAVLRWANLGVGLAVVVVLYLMVRRTAPGWMAAALVLPVSCSKILIGASTSLTTDNACWAVALGAIWGSVLAAPAWRALVVGGVCAVAAVLTRQVCIWLAAPFGLVALGATPLGALIPRAIRPVIERHRWAVFGAASAAVVGVFGVMAVFAWAWGGLVPDHPAMREHFAPGYAWATFAYGLAVVAVFGVFFLPVVWREVARVRWNDGMVWVAAIVGLLSAVIPETGWAARVRSAGPIWGAVRAISAAGGGRMEGTEAGAPIVGSIVDPIAGRSGVIMVAAPVGALIALMLVRAAERAGRGREARVLALTMLGMMVVQGFSVVMGQRYYEPFLVSALAVVAALGLQRTDRVRVWWMVGPVALGAVQLVLTARGIHQPGPGALDVSMVRGGVPWMW
jgi:hypothetical protein